MRERLNLNDDWKYKNDFREAYFEKDFDDRDFVRVRLPHTNVELPYNNFSETIYQFVSCYRKQFTVPADLSGKQALLHFEGVMAYAKVYLNGKFVCDHKGGYTPFVGDMTEFLVYTGYNVLSVMVDSTERDDIPPFGHAVDYLTYGGIYREVFLEFVQKIHIDNIYVKTPDILTGNRKLEIDFYAENRYNVTKAVMLEFELFKEQEKLDHFTEQIRINPGSVQFTFIKDIIAPVKLWNLSEPNLYLLKTSVTEGGNTVDEFEVRFGFREAVFKTDGFYLNGELVKITGMNRHQSYPYAGYAMPKRVQYKDAEILKDLGINMVRTSHYPQSPHFLNRCDELGIMVFEEIPGWQHIGDEAWQKLEITYAEEMVKRDWNHPSVVIWGVRIDESQDNDALYKETNRVAHALDRMRPTGGVRNFGNSSFLEDVYTYNDFSHRGFNEVLRKPGKIYKKKVPYLVTEFNGHMFPTKNFDNEAKRVEHALRHLRVLDAMNRTPGIAGAIGWCLFDYNTHKDFGSGDRICYHGVLDMFRIPKEAAFVYASQQDEIPVMEVASDLNTGEYDAGELTKVYIFTNCDYVTLTKNGESVGIYYPDTVAFPGVKHPPVVVNDLIGGLIEKHEHLSHKDAQTAKEVLRAVVKYGNQTLPLKYKIKMGLVMLKNRMPYEQAVNLYNQYVANFGNKSLVYEFTGYIHDQPVKTIKKGPWVSANLVAKADYDTLIEDETYDAVRVVVKHTDNFGNTLHFSTEIISLSTAGPITIIGPSVLALTGGGTAFWVKTAGESGEGTVTIRSPRFTEQILKFKVEKR